MSISPIQGNGAHESLVTPDQSPAGQELGRRLREQVEINAQLDTEVRYLLQELAIRKEFIAQLESERVAIHALAERQGELVQEFDAYRNRIAHRIIDRLVVGIHRRSWLYKPMRRGARVAIAVARYSRSRATIVVSTSAESKEDSSTPTAHSDRAS
jgi:hypothetical protein